MVQRFQTDDNCKVFLAQIKTGREGITLHSADTMIFYSLDYSYADYEQAKARIHRSGQVRKCTYIHFIAKDTVDEKVMEVLRTKGDVARMVVDDWRSWLS
jgi:SNF2 family DNA or RNA helicase